MMQFDSQLKQSLLCIAQSIVPISRGCFYEVDNDLEPRNYWVLGGDTTRIALYDRIYRLFDPFHPRHLSQLSQPLLTSRDRPLGDAQHERYAREFMKLNNVSHKVELIFRNSSNQIVAGMRLGRDETLGDFSADTLQTLHAFHNVAQRACQHTLIENPLLNLPQPLTHREQQVMRFLMEALPDKSIANELNISLPTVKLHTRSILRKLGVKSRAEAIVWAYRAGFK